jgi:hypothetical protein
VRKRKAQYLLCLTLGGWAGFPLVQRRWLLWILLISDLWLFRASTLSPQVLTVNTPEETPKKRQRDPDVVEVDSLLVSKQLVGATTCVVRIACKLLSHSLNGFCIDFSIDFAWTRSSIVQTNSGVADGGPHSDRVLPCHSLKVPASDSKHAPYQSRIELTELRITARHSAVRRSASCLVG